jgi:hypothetical protein
MLATKGIQKIRTDAKHDATEKPLAQPSHRPTLQSDTGAKPVGGASGELLNLAATAYEGKAIGFGQQHRDRQRTASARCRVKSLSQLHPAPAHA